MRFIFTISKNAYSQELFELIDKGIRAYESGHDGWELEAIGSMSMLFGTLKKYGYFNACRNFARGSDFLQKALTYISKNYGSSVTSADAAAELYMSAGYFCRCFKKGFGCCFSDYLLSYRLEKAKTLLINSDDKITEISSRIGFNSSSYFAKAFKEHFGESPLAYRRREKQK